MAFYTNNICCHLWKEKKQHILNILQINVSENMKIWLYQTFSGKNVILKIPPLLGNV